MLEPTLWILFSGAIAVLGALLAWQGFRGQQDRRRRKAQWMAVMADHEKEREDHRRTEVEWRRKEAWYQALFHTTEDMVFVFGVGPDGLPGHFLDVNDFACARLEYPREKLLDMTVVDIEDATPVASLPRYSRSELAVVSDSEIASRATSFALRAAKTMAGEVLGKKQVLLDRTYVTRSGKKIPVQIHARRFDGMDQPLILCTAHDVTGRKATEQALRESEQRLRDFLAYSPIGIALYDSHRKLTDANPACLQIFGAPDRDEFARFDLFDHPFLPAAAKELLNRGEGLRCEIEMDFGEVQRLDLFVSGRRGMAFFDMLITPLGCGKDFNPSGYLLQVQDITQRRKAEMDLRQSERQLRQAQKMEAIGTLAGGIAHDFNNILTPILGYTEMILETPVDVETTREFVREIHKASTRAKELVNQILTFSRRSESDGKLKPILVAPIVKEVLNLLRASVPANIEINRVIKTEHDRVMGDPTQLHQVVMNLCTNAVHAMRGQGGALEVRMTDFVLGQGGGSEFQHLAPGRYLRVSVKDTGAGIDKAVLERIFEPFFTTKASGEGTGMGLSVVHGIVTGLRGAITVETEVGRGTTFHVVLPTLEEKVVQQTAAVSSLPVGTECVLFVDDDANITKLVSLMLSSLGYEVIAAGQASAALRMVRMNPQQFAAVITDQAMPGMLGTDLARELMAIRPGLPIILCTGFEHEIAKAEAESLGILEFLAKPIELPKLAACVRRAIDRKPPDKPPAREPEPAGTKGG